MTVSHPKVPGFNTTLMGVVRAVADRFELRHSDAALYGGSSHAFLINIHEALCPSGPYCWNPTRFRALLRNLGIAVAEHGFGAQSPAEVRAGVEAGLREKLADGVPCSLLNLENQLITGVDDTGLLTSQPWAPHVDFPPAHLTFGTWEELGDGIHVSFFSYERLEPASSRTIAHQALACAADMIRNPAAYSGAGYAAGPAAYDHWITAVRAGHGASHGNWWNGTVWSECRTRAAEYLEELAQGQPAIATGACELAETYAAVAANLARASDKGLDAVAKVALLEETQVLEVDAGARLAALSDALGPQM